MDKRKKLAKQLLAEQGYSLSAAYNEVDRQHALKKAADAKGTHSVGTLSARDAEIEEFIASIPDEAG